MTAYLAVPLFWDQQGYALKPAPQLSAERSHEQNLTAIRQHFAKIVPAYGPVVSASQLCGPVTSSNILQTIVNLAEQHGKEGQVTTGYGEYATELNSKDVR